MIYNKSMEKYLKQISMNYNLNELSENNDLRILQGSNCFKEKFFYLQDNCCDINSKDSITHKGDDLTQLEWDCNEIYISDFEESICLLQTGLIKVKLIRNILETEYSSQQFDIVMSYDDGEEFEISPSVTIRFYAVRSNDSFITHDKACLEEYIQPILVELVNQRI